MIRRIVPLLSLLLLASCASFPAGGGREPQTIVIRNRSGADISSVTLRDAGRSSGESRFGTIAPVPQGVSQQIGRPTEPPPLPRSIVVEWVDRAGRTIVREVSVAKALKGATGAGDEAIVIEIGPFEDVLVFTERRVK